MDNINNIYSKPGTLKRTYFKKTQREFIDEIKRHAYETCREDIGDEYIKKACNKCKEGYVYTENAKIIGFIIWAIIPTKLGDEKNTIYSPSKRLFIYLVCAEKTDYKLGKTMIYDVEQYAINKYVPLIKLEPTTPELEVYYHTFGYRTFSREPVLMTKPMAELLLPRKIDTRKRRNKTIDSKDKRIIQYYIDNGDNFEAEILHNSINLWTNVKYLN